MNGLRAVKKAIRASEDETYQSVNIKNARKAYCDFSEEKEQFDIDVVDAMMTSPPSKVRGSEE